MIYSDKKTMYKNLLSWLTILLGLSSCSGTSPTISVVCEENNVGNSVIKWETAARLIPVIGKGVGDTVEFGGLFGYAPIMPVNKYSCDDFINRTGRIPAPIHSFKN